MRGVRVPVAPDVPDVPDLPPMGVDFAEPALNVLMSVETVGRGIPWRGEMEPVATCCRGVVLPGVGTGMGDAPLLVATTPAVGVAGGGASTVSSEAEADVEVGVAAIPSVTPLGLGVRVEVGVVTAWAREAASGLLKVLLGLRRALNTSP